MAWIQTVDAADATGIVKAEYDAAIARAGTTLQYRQTFQCATQKVCALS